MCEYVAEDELSAPLTDLTRTTVTSRDPTSFQRLGTGGEDYPPEIFNFKLFIGVAIFGVLGAARGFDEGNVSGMLAAADFQETFGLVKGIQSAHYIATVTGTISAMVQLFSIVGGLGAFIINDKIGRVWSLRLLCVIWILGVVLEMTAYNLVHLYIGRAIAGIGVGATTVVGPVYLVEIAPASIRGLCSGIFSGFVYLGIMLSYFANFGSQLHQSGRIRWIIPLTLQILFATMALAFSIFATESPRFLMLIGKKEHAIQNLVRLRGLPRDHDFVQTELKSIVRGLEVEERALAGKSVLGRMFEIVSTTANRYRLIGIGLMIQLLGQWSGANSITIYAPEYFALMGISGTNEKLFITSIFGIVKFMASLACALFLIDRIGRKRALYLGLGLQTLSMFYIANFLAFAPPESAGEENGTFLMKLASTGGVIMIYVNGCGWALGWNSIQYLLGTEIWPLHLRSLGSSFIMAFHFANQFANSKILPVMLLDRDQGGLGAANTMFLFFLVCILGLIYVYAFLPEASGHSLETLDELFARPWWQIGRYSKNVPQPDAFNRVPADSADEAQNPYLEKRRSSSAESQAMMEDIELQPINRNQVGRETPGTF